MSAADTAMAIGSAGVISNRKLRSNCAALSETASPMTSPAAAIASPRVAMAGACRQQARLEDRRHDPHDRERLVFGAYRPADNRWVRAEALAPERFADHEHAIAPFLVLITREEAAK